MKRCFVTERWADISALGGLHRFIPSDARRWILHSVALLVVVLGSTATGFAGTIHTAGQVRIPNLACHPNFTIRQDGEEVKYTHCYVKQENCQVRCIIYCYSDGLRMASTTYCGYTQCESPSMCLWNKVAKQYTRATVCEYPAARACSNQWGDECASVAIMKQSCLRDRFQTPCADTDGVEVCCESI